MRITHMVSHGTLNGVATATKTLIDQQLAAGHEIMLVHKTDGWLGQQPFARPVERLATNFDTKPSELRRVGYKILDWRRDLLHAHGSRANKYMMIYRIIAGVPSVTTGHARKVQIPWAFAHEIIAPSEQTAAYYRRMLPWKRISVVPHPFDPGAGERADTAERSAVRRELGIGENAFVMGSIGTVGERKNQVAMLDLLGPLLERGIDAVLVLIGDVMLSEKHRARLADPRFKGRVLLTGQRSDATRVLSAFDLYLCTSRVEEGPIASFEAMAARLPVLTSDVGHSNRLIETGVNGGLFPIGSTAGMADMAERYARDPQARLAAGEAARAAVIRELAPAGIMPRIDAVYQRAMARAHDRYRARMPKPAS